MQITSGCFCPVFPEAVLQERKSEEGFILCDSDREQSSRIVAAYLDVLENINGTLAPENRLPFPKDQIAEAIIHELTANPESDLQRRLEIAYVMLEAFIPYEEYCVIENYKSASRCAEEIADIGNPSSILISAQILKNAMGDKAVKLEEKIYEKMKERQLYIHELLYGEAL